MASMRIFVRKKHNGIVTFILDLMAILGSLLLAVALRAQFSNFLFDLQGALSLFPLTLLLRFTVLVVSEEYTSSHGLVSTLSVRKIIILNIIATAFLVFLRYQIPIPLLHMPISMIGTEYFLTTFFMSYIRSTVLSRIFRPTGYLGHVKTLILWADPQQLKELLIHIPSLLQDPGLRFLGSLNANSISWFSQIHGIQVYGNESWIPRLVAVDDRIEGIVILKPDLVPRGILKRIYHHAHTLTLQVYSINSLDYSLQLQPSSSLPGE